MNEICVIMHQTPPHDFHLLAAGFDIEVLKESYTTIKMFICEMAVYDLKVIVAELT